MSETKVFVTGVRFFDKHANAPDFVIGTLVISPNELFKWLQDNPGMMTQYNGQPQVKMQVKRSQAGQLYCELDQWKPQQQQAPAQQYQAAPPVQQQPTTAPTQQWGPQPQQPAPQQPAPAPQQPNGYVPF